MGKVVLWCARDRWRRCELMVEEQWVRRLWAKCEGWVDAQVWSYMGCVACNSPAQQ